MYPSIIGLEWRRNSLLNHLLLVDSGIRNCYLLSSISTDDSTILLWMVQIQSSHRWPWFNWMDHRTKPKDVILKGTDWQSLGQGFTEIRDSVQDSSGTLTLTGLFLLSASVLSHSWRHLFTLRTAGLPCVTVSLNSLSSTYQYTQLFRTNLV